MVNDNLRGSVTAAIILVMVLGILTVTVVVLGAVKGQTYQISEGKINELYFTSYTANYTFTALNDTQVSIGNLEVLPSGLVIRNGTDLVGSGNYTLNATYGQVIFSGPTYNATAMNASYNHKNRTTRESVRMGIISAFDADKTLQDYLPTFGLAMMVLLILGVIVGLFWNSTKGIGGGSV